MVSFIETFELLLKELKSQGKGTQLFSIIDGLKVTYEPNKNYNDSRLDLRKLTETKINELKKLMIQLDAINLHTELAKMKVYYQINLDTRTPNTQSLYAKAVTPKFGKDGKRKHIGIRYGSLNKYPEGWTEKHKTEAKRMLMQKAFSYIMGV